MLASLSCTHSMHVRAASDARGVAGLEWLAGRWVSRTGAGFAEESWTTPAGGAMQGSGRVVEHEHTAFFEFMTIEASDATLVFTAYPNGHPPTRFTVASQRRGEVVFENRDHDFPNRITYRLEPDGRLFTRAEGTENGRAVVDVTRFDRAD